MNIKKDTIIFAAEDFAGLSNHAQKAVSAYYGDYAAYFSMKVSREIESAKAHLKSLAAADPITDSILTGLASADEAKLLEAEPLLIKLNDLLKSP